MATETPYIIDYEDTIGGDSDTTSPATITAPSDITENELLVIVLATDSIRSDWIQAAPSGWTKLIEAGYSSNTECHMGFFYKVATGEEGASEDVGLGGSYHYVARYMRITSIDPADPINTSNFEHDDPLPTYFPSLVTDENNCLVLGITCYNDSGPVTLTGSGYSMVGDALEGEGDLWLGMVEKDMDSAGTAGSGVMNAGGSLQGADMAVAINGGEPLTYPTESSGGSIVGPSVPDIKRAHRAQIWRKIPHR